MKRVLVFGDSLSWGFIPGTLGKRYGPDIRWPRVLQTLLADEYEVIEETLNGRTTVLDDPYRLGRNGLDLLQPLLESHAPLDLVVIMLGSNDLLHHRDLTAFDVARGMNLLIDVVQRYVGECQVRPSEVLIMAPPCGESLSADMAPGCKGELSKFADVAPALEALAKQKGCHYFDVTRVVEQKEVSDGIHLNEDANKRLAGEFSKTIKEVL